MKLISAAASIVNYQVSYAHWHNRTQSGIHNHSSQVILRLCSCSHNRLRMMMNVHAEVSSHNTEVSAGG